MVDPSNSSGIEEKTIVKEEQLDEQIDDNTLIKEESIDEQDEIGPIDDLDVTKTLITLDSIEEREFPRQLESGRNYSLSIMTETNRHDHCEVGESSKLVGIQN
jgi:hypothetical protein